MDGTRGWFDETAPGSAWSTAGRTYTVCRRARTADVWRYDEGRNDRRRARRHGRLQELKRTPRCPTARSGRRARCAERQVQTGPHRQRQERRPAHDAHHIPHGAQGASVPRATPCMTSTRAGIRAFTVARQRRNFTGLPPAARPVRARAPRHDDTASVLHGCGPQDRHALLHPQALRPAPPPLHAASSTCSAPSRSITSTRNSQQHAASPWAAPSSPSCRTWLLRRGASVDGSPTLLRVRFHAPTLDAV